MEQWVVTCGFEFHWDEMREKELFIPENDDYIVDLWAAIFDMVIQPGVYVSSTTTLHPCVTNSKNNPKYRLEWECGEQLTDAPNFSKCWWLWSNRCQISYRSTFHCEKGCADDRVRNWRRRTISVERERRAIILVLDETTSSLHDRGSSIPRRLC